VDKESYLQLTENQTLQMHSSSQNVSSEKEKSHSKPSAEPEVKKKVVLIEEESKDPVGRKYDDSRCEE